MFLPDSCLAAVMHLSFESSKKSDSLLDCLWLYHIFSLQTVSNFIGAIEIVVAVLIGVRSFSAKLSFVGSIGAVITFLLTVSFLFSTPGAFQFSNGFPLLGDAGQFLIKDLVLLGAAVWTPRKRGNPTSRVVVLAS